jgi:hypothetical protein
MKVTVLGQGDITLTQKDFVASGGEGHVYTRGGTAYKIYIDPKRALPAGKITELAVLTEPNIIKPEIVLLDPVKHHPIGYTMRFVRDTLPMCQVITRAFREREGIDHSMMLKLIQRLQALVDHTHKAGVLIVDLNELNYLVNKAFDDVYGIDVDSYQTKSYPATAIMPSVRDWSVQGHAFTEGSDWFSFACIAYQMFTCIHPFKGKHPTVHGLEARMKAGLSVFDADVSVPKVVYPNTVIPPGYLAWFKAVLQDGKRVAPPSDPGSFVAVAVASRIVMGGAALDIDEVHTYRDMLLGFTESNGTRVAWMRSGVWVNDHPALGPTHVQAIGFSPKQGHVIVAWTDGPDLRLYNATTQQAIPVTLRADDVRGHEGRIYVRSTDRVIEVILHEMSGQIIPTPKVVTQVLEHSSRLFDGAVVQDMLGSIFVSVYPRSGASFQTRIPELEAYKIVDAKCDGRVLMVVGTLKSKPTGYDRLTFVFDESFTTYKRATTVQDVPLAGMNFIVLDSGICVHLTEDEKLEVWSVNAPGKIKVVEDKVLGGDMRLVKYGGRVAFVRGDKVSTIRMK